MTRSWHIATSLMLTGLTSLVMGATLGAVATFGGLTWRQDCVEADPLLHSAMETGRSAPPTRPPRSLESARSSRPRTEWASMVRHLDVKASVQEDVRSMCDDLLCVALVPIDAKGVPVASLHLTFAIEDAARQGVPLCGEARTSRDGGVELALFSSDCSAAEAIRLRARAMLDDLVEEGSGDTGVLP